MTPKTQMKTPITLWTLEYHLQRNLISSLIFKKPFQHNFFLWKRHRTSQNYKNLKIFSFTCSCENFTQVILKVHDFNSRSEFVETLNDVNKVRVIGVEKMMIPWYVALHPRLLKKKYNKYVVQISKYNKHVVQKKKIQATLRSYIHKKTMYIRNDFLLQISHMHAIKKVWMK